MTVLEAIDSLLKKGYDSLELLLGTEITFSLGKKADKTELSDLFDTFSPHFEMNLYTDDEDIMVKLKKI